MKNRIEQDGFDSYFVCEAKEEKKMEFIYEILNYNIVPGVLHPCIYKKEAGELWYGLNGYIQFEKYIQNQEEEQVIQIMQNFIACLEGLAKYMLSSEDVVLQVEHIYVKEETREVGFALIPGQDTEVRQRFISFVEYYLNHIDHQMDELVAYAYELYDQVRSDHFSLEKILEIPIDIEVVDCEEIIYDEDEVVNNSIKLEKNSKPAPNIRTKKPVISILLLSIFMILSAIGIIYFLCLPHNNRDIGLAFVILECSLSIEWIMKMKQCVLSYHQ